MDQRNKTASFGAMTDDVEIRRKILSWARTPHAVAIDLRFRDDDARWARGEMPYLPALVGEPPERPYLNGLLTAMLDETGSHAAQFALDRIRSIATLDLRLDYIQTPLPGAPIHARAYCHATTPSIAYVRSYAYQDDGESERILANADSAFMIGANDKNMYRESARIDAGKLPPPTEYSDPPHDEPLHSYARFLNARKDGPDRFILRYDPKLIGNPSLPAIHGGVIGAFLELTAQTCIDARAEGAIASCISHTTNYLRSGRPTETCARAEIVKFGKRVVSFQTIAWQDDPSKPIATSFGHFLLTTDAKTPADAP